MPTESASVNVVVKAVTQAAQQAIDEVGDELRDVATDASVGQSTLDEFSDELDETTRSAVGTSGMMEVLERGIDGVKDEARKAARAIDDMGDESTETAAQSGAAAGAMAGMAGTMNAARAASMALNFAFILSLIPAIITLTSVLAPLTAGLLGGVAALGGLVAAIGGVLGTGFLAWGEELSKQNEERLDQVNSQIRRLKELKETTGELSSAEQTRLQNLKESKKELDEQTGALGALKGELKSTGQVIKQELADFGTQFIPLVKDATNALPGLVENITSAIGPTDGLRQNMRNLGGAVADVLPGLISFLFELGEDAMPVVTDFIEWWDENGAEVWEDVAASMEELQPEAQELLNTLMEHAPTILEFGTNVLDVLIPALTDLVDAVAPVMEDINNMDEDMQELVIGGLLLAPVILKLASAFTTLIGLFKASGVAGGGGGVLSSVAGGLSTIKGILLGPAGIIAAITGVTIAILRWDEAFQKVRDSAADLFNKLGEEKANALLTAGNILSAGSLEKTAKLGAGVRGFVRGPGGVLAGQRFNRAGNRVGTVDETFERADNRSADAVNPFNEAGVYMPNATIKNQIKGEARQNPYRYSRIFGSQLQREARNSTGAGP